MNVSGFERDARVVLLITTGLAHCACGRLGFESLPLETTARDGGVILGARGKDRLTPQGPAPANGSSLGSASTPETVDGDKPVVAATATTSDPDSSPRSTSSPGSSSVSGGSVPGGVGSGSNPTTGGAPTDSGGGDGLAGAPASRGGTSAEGGQGGNDGSSASGSLHPGGASGASAGSPGSFGATGGASGGSGGASGPSTVPTGNTVGSCLLSGGEISSNQFDGVDTVDLSLTGPGTIGWSSQVGNPSLGSIEFQNASGGSSLLHRSVAADLSGRVLQVNVLVESGTNPRLQLIAESEGAPGRVGYGEPFSPNLGQWYCLAFNLESPVLPASDVDFDASRVTMLGLMIWGEGSVRAYADQLAY